MRGNVLVYLLVLLALVVYSIAIHSGAIVERLSLIGAEWWILYAILVPLLFCSIVAITAPDTNTRTQYYGLGMLHEDLEEIKRLLESTRG
jgi:hypothetical protein